MEEKFLKLTILEQRFSNKTALFPVSEFFLSDHSLSSVKTWLLAMYLAQCNEIFLITRLITCGFSIRQRKLSAGYKSLNLLGKRRKL